MRPIHSLHTIKNHGQNIIDMIQNMDGETPYQPRKTNNISVMIRNLLSCKSITR